MAITSKGLQKLGFVSGTDFVLEDDGSGVKMTWLSGSAEPSLSDIETAHTQWENSLTAETTNTASAKTKLKALGLTDDELRDAFGL